MKRSANQRLKQAYKDAPWRGQIRTLGVIGAVILLGAILSWLHVDFSTRTALFGREIQELQEESLSLKRDILTLETELANLHSIASVKARMEDMGFDSTQYFSRNIVQDGLYSEIKTVIISVAVS